MGTPKKKHRLTIV